MLAKLLIACILVAVTVTIHSLGVAVLVRTLIKSNALSKPGSLNRIWLLICLALWLILLHATAISIWGMFYLWQGCMPDAESAFYFSGVTYTTVGYGDLVLPQPWRIIAAIEALTGILMCGLSTGLFFVVVQRFVSHFIAKKP
jgi:hypothetical protein